MPLTRLDDHTQIDEAAAVGARDLHRLAAVEPGSELEPSPPRTDGRSAGHPFEPTLPPRQNTYTAEAHGDLGAGLQPKQTGANGPVSAAPASLVARGELTSDRSPYHAPLSRPAQGRRLTPQIVRRGGHAPSSTTWFTTSGHVIRAAAPQTSAPGDLPASRAHIGLEGGAPRNSPDPCKVVVLAARA
jgi:hypothetical protein